MENRGVGTALLEAATCSHGRRAWDALAGDAERQYPGDAGSTSNSAGTWPRCIPARSSVSKDQAVDHAHRRTRHSDPARNRVRERTCLAFARQLHLAHRKIVDHEAADSRTADRQPIDGQIADGEESDRGGTDRERAQRDGTKRRSAAAGARVTCVGPLTTSFTTPPRILAGQTYRASGIFSSLSAPSVSRTSAQPWRS